MCFSRLFLFSCLYITQPQQFFNCWWHTLYAFPSFPAKHFPRYKIWQDWTTWPQRTSSRRNWNFEDHALGTYSVCCFCVLSKQENMLCSAELRLDPVWFVPLTVDYVPFIICFYCIHLSIRYRLFCSKWLSRSSNAVRGGWWYSNGFHPPNCYFFLTKRTSYRTSCRGMFSKTCPIYLQLWVCCTLGSFETPAMLPHVHVLEQTCLEQRQRLHLDTAGNAYY